MLICALFAAASLAACSPRNSANAEKYQEVDSSKIVCSLHDSNVVNRNGEFAITGVGKVSCYAPPDTEDVDIELASHDAPDGIISTKDFGTIKIKSEQGNGGYPYLSVSMKPSDASKLEKFLRKHRKPQSPPATQAPQKTQK